ncbi:metal ABC transporter permease [Pararhodobacter sp. SW119]|uniref:metal ABC transporter permease n=1 Tax=Pararhodobacter sp. SW119 TaxID=2780075 RepID=UPI001ADF98D0|nr:metal ABC transporter permease [Pararhodobacter sp. SW119]
MIAAFLDSTAAMIVLTGVLVGVSGALLGTFLVLGGRAMLTDAISHAIVFGIIVVWLLTRQMAGPVQVIGAAAAGMLTVLLSEALARTRLVRTDAAIGLVFPALFSAGVILIALNARNVHIDTESVLLGEIGFVWLETVTVAGLRVPVAVLTLAAVLAVNLAFVLGFWKELKLATFDPVLAAALGFAPGLMFHALLALTSVTAVAAFDAVGAVLFIAFVIVPPATGFLLTRRVGRMAGLAVGLAAASAGAGYALAVRWDVSIAGMMALMTGVFFTLALLLAPDQGLIARALHLRAERAANDARTLVAHLFTHQHTAAMDAENTARALIEHLRWPEARARAAILSGLDRDLVRREGPLLWLTEKGQAMARGIFDPAGRGTG